MKKEENRKYIIIYPNGDECDNIEKQTTKLVENGFVPEKLLINLKNYRYILSKVLVKKTASFIDDIMEYRLFKFPSATLEVIICPTIRKSIAITNNLTEIEHFKKLKQLRKNIC